MILLRRLLPPFSKSNRIRSLPDTKISLTPSTTSTSSPTSTTQSQSTPPSLSQLRQLGWQRMPFDQLCNLPSSTLSSLQMQVKIDKFNIPDSQFYDYYQQQPKTSLSPYHRQISHLLKNQHQLYNQTKNNLISQSHQRYKAQLYIYQLQKDPHLQQVITYFLTNLAEPTELEAIAEPSLVKKILAVKRELIMQGVKFQNKVEKKEIKKEIKKISKQIKKNNDKDKDNDEEYIKGTQQQQIVEEVPQEEEEDLGQSMQKQAKLSNRLSQLLARSPPPFKVELVTVLSYQYEFWVDVRHNRSKNTPVESFIIEQRQIDHPNPSLLLKQNPKIKVKYIVHKKKRKDCEMSFVNKAQILIKIDQLYQRVVKIQWKGPGNKEKTEMKDTESGLVDFRVIDYEGIMKGNPTIRSVFDL